METKANYEGESAFEYIYSLSLPQKLSGLSFILAKVTCVVAAPLIFINTELASYLVGSAFALIVFCIVMCIISSKHSPNIDELLKDPEIRKEIEQKLKS